MNTHTIEVTQRNGKWQVILLVWGQERERFSYKTERAAVRKVQELERTGYTLTGLPRSA
jgi:hypothetical protein